MNAIQICKWENSGLDFRAIVNLLEKIGDLLPDPLRERINVTEYAEKLLKYGVVYVAIAEDHTPLGIIGFYANDFIEKRAYLSIIGILPEWQGCGIGKTFINKLIADCKKAEMTSISLKVHKKNASALVFYKTQGFVIAEKESLKFVMNINL